MNKPISLAVFSLHACPLASQEGKETGGLNVYVLETAKEHLLLIDTFTKAFFDFAKKENLSYDLLHGHYYFSGLAGLKVKRRLKIPLAMTFHTLALMKNLVGRTTDEKEEEHRINAELELVQKADCLIATSDSDQAYLKYLYGAPQKKISVATPGVDTKLFSEIPQLEAKKEIGADKKHKIILAVERAKASGNFASTIRHHRFGQVCRKRTPIEDLITNGNKFAKVKEKLKNEAEKYTWAKTARKMHQVYQNSC